VVLDSVAVLEDNHKFRDTIKSPKAPSIRDVDWVGNREVVIPTQPAMDLGSVVSSPEGVGRVRAENVLGVSCKLSESQWQQ